MRNYFHQLESKAAKYRNKYSENPRRAALRMGLWNLVCAMRKFAPVPATCADKSPIRDDVLRIAIAEGGGIGDACFQTTYIKEIRKMFSRPVVIDFFCRAYRAFDGFPFIDNCMPYSQDLALDDYDVFIVSRRFYIVVKIDDEKTKRFSRRFYDFCMDCRRLTGETLNMEYNDNLYSQYCILLGKNRLEQADPHGLIPVNRMTPRYMSWADDASGALDEFGLQPGKYITINRGAGTPQPGRHPKLWPLDYYTRLVEMVRDAYPQYKIVQIGTPDGTPPIVGTDINLVGKTSLDQVKVILKYAALHIDGEGGMVHMRRFLNGASMVFFGPTRVDVFGYPENINLRGTLCDGGCEWVTPNWYNGCVRGFDVSPCMRAITPDMAFGELCKFLDGQSKYEFVAVPRKWRPTHGADIAVIGRMDAVSEFVHAGANVMVFDLDLQMPDGVAKNCDYLAVAHRGGFNAEFASPYNIPAADESFDVVYVEHLPDCKNPDLCMHEYMRILRVGGALILGGKYLKKFVKHKPGGVA